MPQLNISLPTALKSWVDGRVGDGHFSSASDYVRDLIRREAQKTNALAVLQAALDKGLASGVDAREPAQILAISARNMPPCVAKPRFSAHAAADLDDVFAVSAGRFGFDTADEYFTALQVNCQRLADSPELGSVLDGIRPPMRIFSYRSHNIYYRFDGQAVLVVRILHHAMNAAAHLR